MFLPHFMRVRLHGSACLNNYYEVQALLITTFFGMEKRHFFLQHFYLSFRGSPVFQGDRRIPSSNTLYHWYKLVPGLLSPSSTTFPSTRDSSRRYFFTLLLPFLHHYSLWQYVGVLVKQRLLGMTGVGRAPQATEEFPSHIPRCKGKRKYNLSF